MASNVETTTVQVGRGAAIHLAYAPGGRSLIPVCGVHLSRGRRRAGSITPAQGDVTCSRCLASRDA